MTSDPRESSFIRAAQVAIKDLQDEARDLKTEIRDARKAARRRNFWQVMIGIGVMASITLAAVTSFLYFQQQNIIDAQRHASIASCQAGNSYRENIKDTLYFFTDVLASQQPAADVQREVAGARDYLNSLAGTDPAVKADAEQFYQLLERVSNVTKDPGLPALVTSVKAHIAHINAPRNCMAAYNAAAG